MGAGARGGARAACRDGGETMTTRVKADALVSIVRGACVKRGDKTRLSAALGVHPSLLSRALADRTYEVGDDACSRIAVALGDDWWYAADVVDRAVVAIEAHASAGSDHVEEAAIARAMSDARHLSPRGCMRLTHWLLGRAMEGE